jgi:hypothetical protein
MFSDLEIYTTSTMSMEQYSAKGRRNKIEGESTVGREEKTAWHNRSLASRLANSGQISSSVSFP